MIFLLISVFLSVLTVCFFKLFERYQVNTFQAIIANYLACVVIGNVTSGKAIITQPFYAEPWFLYTFILGTLFICTLYSIGMTAQKMGISASMTAAKLSVVIPVTLGCLIHGETINAWKVAGILLSLVSVFLISKKETLKGQTPNRWLWLLPVIVFTGSGIIDAMLGFIQKRFIPPSDAGDILSIVFLAAFSIGALILIIQRERVRFKSIWWGTAMAIPNFFCMYFLVKTLEQFDTTFVFPLNNIGTVLCSAIAAIAFFHEKLSNLNRIGLILAIGSILMIAFA